MREEKEHNLFIRMKRNSMQKAKKLILGRCCPIPQRTTTMLIGLPHFVPKSEERAWKALSLSPLSGCAGLSKTPMPNAVGLQTHGGPRDRKVNPYL